MSFIPKAAFPNVPKLPGVPQLNRSSLFPAGLPPAVNSVIALGRLALALTTKPQWGIYKAVESEIPADEASTTDAAGNTVLPEVVVKPPAQPVLVPDNFMRLGMTQAWDVTDAPVQEGSFVSYNKVATPFEVRLRMTKGGSQQDRQEFLEKLESISGTTDLYKILTPERTYVGVNITEYRVIRDGAKGAYFLSEVEISFREVMVVTAEYTTTSKNTQKAKDPSAQPAVNRGTLNSIPAIGRAATLIDNALAPLRRVSSVFGG